MLPVLVFIFFMGWSTYWIGDTKRPQRRQAAKRKKPKQEDVTILPAILEEMPLIENE
jgi:hypothetical protein